MNIIKDMIRMYLTQTNLEIAIHQKTVTVRVVFFHVHIYSFAILFVLDHSYTFFLFLHLNRIHNIIVINFVNTGQ